MKKAAVLGFGVSGKAALRLLEAVGDYEIFVFDDSDMLPGCNNFYCGEEVEELSRVNPDLIVVSPGIPKSNPMITYALESGGEVVSEVELAFRYTDIPIVGVTGTNGKTTTVAIIDRIMNKSGLRSVACGNYGLAMSDVVASGKKYDYLIVELSSYQLEFVKHFKPYVAVLLNISPDHIRWHGNFQAYVRAKFNIFKNQTSNDWAVINETLVNDYSGKAESLVFSRTSRVADCFVCVDSVSTKMGVIHPKWLKGIHNMENVAAASLVAMACGIEWKTIREECESMETLEHRIEFVGELDGVKFYNDSKSTNRDSVINALNVFEDGKVVLILGGKHKGEPFSEILDLLRKKTKGIVVYGEDRKIYLEDLKSMIPVPLPALNLWGAIRAAFEIAGNGDVVLFSPGGSSCKPFKNYEERGEAFKREFFILKDEYEKTPGF